MEHLVTHHTRILHLLAAVFLASTVLYGAVVLLVPPPDAPVVMQTHPLLWVFASLTLLNLLTIMPVYRAMLAKPRRVYAVSQDPEPLLRAHLIAHLVAMGRLELIALMGVVLFLVTGRGDWFWYFNGLALVSMLVLWPLREKVENLLQLPSVSQEGSAYSSG
ncbi:MAG: hypothetical protein NZ869_07370 [Thermoanaerobaculum sp.]|nr:hypothetical protein [Thermoanaerobaculum sp.]MDW7967160.1 hypothetical protein [Thermoanaerobaculum sp.]